MDFNIRCFSDTMEYDSRMFNIFVVFKKVFFDFNTQKLRALFLGRFNQALIGQTVLDDI